MDDQSAASDAMSRESAAEASTTADEEVARVDDRRFRVVAIVAGALFTLQVLPHAFMPLFVLPTFSRMFSDMGGTLPAPTAIMVAMGPWLAVVLLAIDALVFWGFYRLARKYWIGLLFAPLFAMGVLSGLFVWVLYMPMYNVITLVE